MRQTRVSYLLPRDKSKNVGYEIFKLKKIVRPIAKEFEGCARPYIFYRLAHS